MKLSQLLEANQYEHSFKAQLLKTKEEIVSWLDMTKIRNYNINNNLTVDVDGDVNLSLRSFVFLPIQFGNVEGFFTCSQNLRLKSLLGCPRVVGGYFECSDTGIETFEGAPELVRGAVFAHACKNLVSLEGAPMYIKGDFNIKNCPRVSSIKNLHKITKRIDGTFYCLGTNINSNILSLIKIEGLKSVDLPLTSKHGVVSIRKLEEIIERYLPEGDIFACQQELIDAGFEEYAQL